MALDLQKLTLKRLIDTQSNDLYSKLVKAYFTGSNSTVFDRINAFYKANTKLPNKEELLILHKDAGLQEYIENQICSAENQCDALQNEFLLAQLQDYFVREETITFLDDLVSKLDDLEKVEIVDHFQNHLLNLNHAIPYDDELFDVADLDMFPTDGDVRLFASGLSAEYDAVNGGFATQELILLGGRRGSGKSIISLNIALKRFLEGNTVALFSIEMRYKEVYDRILSIISEVPFLNIYRNSLSDEERVTIARAKFKTFYKPSSIIDKLLLELETTKDHKTFQKRINIEKPEQLDNRLFIIDDASLTLNRIDHYCNMFMAKYPNFNMAVIDYLNIIKHEDQKDWKTQIVIADSLKTTARKFDLTLLSPYQIDASGEARFAKGILDSADRSFNFFPPPENEDRSLQSSITVHTTKMRNGKHMSFEVGMNWECVKVDANSTKLINERPHNAAKYGTDNEKQGPKDV